MAIFIMGHLCIRALNIPWFWLLGVVFDLCRPSWLVDSNRIATKIKSASGTNNPRSVEWKSNPSKSCPNCQHTIDNSDVQCQLFIYWKVRVFKSTSNKFVNILITLWNSTYTQIEMTAIDWIKIHSQVFKSSVMYNCRKWSA